jgi:hypothetical protein
MPTVNIQQLRVQAQYLQRNEGLSETEAITRAIEAAGINEEFATEINLEAEISRVMNITAEQQRAEAEQQLQAQAEAAGNTSAITLDTGVTPAPAEADTSMQGTTAAAATETDTTAPTPTGEEPPQV